MQELCRKSKEVELLSPIKKEEKDPAIQELIKKMAPRPESFEGKTICALCGKSVDVDADFKDELSKKEWLISHICQECQDKTFASNKKQTKELDLTYSTVVGHSNDQLIKLGYKLSDKFSLEGEADQQGRTGIDLKFKYKFK